MPIIVTVTGLQKLRFVVWVMIIFLFILSVLTWLLISPLILEIDTRIPVIEVRWVSIGKAMIWYENEWLLSFRVLFFRKTVRMEAIKGKSGKKKVMPGQRKKRGLKRMPLRMLQVAGTFSVVQWKLAIDTGDYPLNGILYPLNFLPRVSGHLSFNYNGENYLHAKLRNRPWKIVYAFFR